MIKFYTPFWSQAQIHQLFKPPWTRQVEANFPWLLKQPSWDFLQTTSSWNTRLVFFFSSLRHTKQILNFLNEWCKKLHYVYINEYQKMSIKRSENPLKLYPKSNACIFLSSSSLLLDSRSLRPPPPQNVKATTNRKGLRFHQQTDLFLSASSIRVWGITIL